MSDQDNCPFCGAVQVVSTGRSPAFTSVWTCGTHARPDTAPYQSDACRISQLEQENAGLRIIERLYDEAEDNLTRAQVIITTQHERLSAAAAECVAWRWWGIINSVTARECIEPAKARTDALGGPDAWRKEDE